jgi:adenine-specific DNA-methyltransferase
MRYIGSKVGLLAFIERPLREHQLHEKSFCDIFSGTTVVARHFKKKGYSVIANDNMTYSYVFEKAYIENNDPDPQFEGLGKLADGRNSSRLSNVVLYLNNLKGTEGFVFDNFCVEGRTGKKYGRNCFTASNAKRIDAIRNKIEDWKTDGKLAENEYYILLAAVLEAIPFVSNISGTFGAFLKSNDPRMFKEYRLEVPELIPSRLENKCFQMDANELIRKISCDVLYIDPPYNERQYAPNYHVLETVAVWDKKLMDNKTGLRPWRDKKSLYCVKEKCVETFEDLIENSESKYILFSYNTEGIIPSRDIKRILKSKGTVETYSKGYRRFKSNSNGDAQVAGLKELLYFVKVR